MTIAMAMMMTGMALIFAPVWVWPAEASHDRGKNMKDNKITMKYLLDSSEKMKEGEGGESDRAVSND